MDNVDGLLKNILQDKQQDKTEQAGKNGGGDPAASYTPNCSPADIMPPFHETHTNNCADDCL
jgi:hypothetical protein